MNNSDVNQAIAHFRSVVGRHYADFAGRVSRRDYWTYIAVYVAVAILATLVQGILGLGFGSLVQLALLLPTAGMTARRLQDTGKNGQLAWLFFIPSAISNIVVVLVATSFGVLGLLLLLFPLMSLVSLVSLAAAIYLIYLCVQPGTQGANAYGPEPDSMLA